MVRKRRKRYPSMHIYHYAAYEKSTLLRLAGRYGVGENEVDDLLRNGVLVDLYPVGAQEHSGRHRELQHQVPRAALHGQRAAQRRGHHRDRLDHRVRPLLRAARRRAATDDAATVLKEIEDYNRYDCRSTRRLRDWLLARAIESRGAAARPAAGAGDGARPASRSTDELERTLMKFAGDGVERAHPEQTAVAMIAAARGYHKREDKPFWWAHFDRVNNPVDEWSDNSDVFIADDATRSSPTGISRRGRASRSGTLRLSGEIANGELSADMYALYDPPAPGRPRRRPGPARLRPGDGARVRRPGGARPRSLIVERAAQGRRRLRPAAVRADPGPADQRPSRCRSRSTRAAAAGRRRAADTCPPTRSTDILLRRPPRTVSGGPLPRTGDDVADITAALLDLDSSYLAVHGPPGTGKTYTAAQVIAALVNDHGWRIGVVAQSHAVVENLFGDVIGAGVDPARVGKKLQTATAPWTELDREGLRRPSSPSTTAA